MEKVELTGFLVEDEAVHRDDLRDIGIKYPAILLRMADRFANTFEPESVDDLLERLL